MARVSGMKRRVVITGAEDIVTDGASTLLVANGAPLMGRVVGTGCMAASVIGTFAAVEHDHVAAAAAGLACYEIAAELAIRESKGPGTFKVALLDAAASLDAATVRARQRVRRA